MLFSIGVKEAIDLCREWLDKSDADAREDWNRKVRSLLQHTIWAQELGCTSVQVEKDMVVLLLAVLCEGKNK